MCLQHWDPPQERMNLWRWVHACGPWVSAEPHWWVRTKQWGRRWSQREWALVLQPTRSTLGDGLGELLFHSCISACVYSPLSVSRDF